MFFLMSWSKRMKTKTFKKTEKKDSKDYTGPTLSAPSNSTAPLVLKDADWQFQKKHNHNFGM